MSELADETDSKSVVRKGVWVRVPPPAPYKERMVKSCHSFFSLNKNCYEIIATLQRKALGRHICLGPFCDIMIINGNVIMKEISMKEKFLLIDGSSLIFRAFFAIRHLTTKDGVHTNGVYGFLNMYKKALEIIEPDYVVVAFDRSGPTFRNKDYEAYKGNREKTPPELAADIYRHGIYLTGGASQVGHLAERLAVGTGLKVNVSENPIASVAIGLSKIIKEDNYKTVAYAIEGMSK